MIHRHQRNFILLIVFCLVTLTRIYYKNVCRDTSATLRLHNNVSPDFSKRSLALEMQEFPWNDLTKAANIRNFSSIQAYTTHLMTLLVPYLLIPPVVAVDTQCIAPKLEIPLDVNCNKLKTPRKIGMLLQFGFNVDALEIHLNELDAVVDKFFITEAVQAHSMLTVQKPLIWDKVKFEERFRKFIPKIVHFVVDDEGLSGTNSAKDMWSREEKQQEIRWQKFIEWNNVNKYFKYMDVLGFGDEDEISNRNNVYFLKNCRMLSDPIDIGLWFPINGTNSIYSSDFPVKKHLYTYADPTFWSLNTALSTYKDTGRYPTRLRGKSNRYLLGGVHLSRNTYMPYILIKHITMSSGGLAYLQKTVDIGTLYADGLKGQAERKSKELPEKWALRTKVLEDYRKDRPDEVEKIVKVPWFLECNLNRFPNFNDNRDAREDISL